MSRPLTIADHSAAQKALRAACIVVSLAAVKTPEQVAAEIAARVVHNLRAKLPTEAARREIAR